MQSRNQKYSDIQKLTVEPTPKAANSTSRTMFRGFIPANSIRTKKGYIGSKLDSLWARYILDSFVNDDSELADAAMDSCLCDKNITIEGGDFGTPYVIGNYGFFAVSQFDAQAKTLQLHERELANKDNAFYLSVREWEFVDVKIGRYAKYGEARVQQAFPGDTLLMLAVREAAFEVATVMIRRDFEPLATNVSGDDMMELLRQRYNEFSEGMRLLHADVEEMSQQTIVPSAMEALLAKDAALVAKVRDLLTFLEFLQDYFVNKRLVQIEQDKWTMRKLELRHQDVPYEVRWNVSQEEVVQTHTKLASDMHTYATDRLNLHLRHLQDIDIRSVLAGQQAVTAEHSSALLCDTIDDETFARLESTLQVKKKDTGAAKNKHLHQLQVFYTEDPDGTRNYVVTDLNEDKTQYSEITYVKPNCAENEEVMYR